MPEPENAHKQSPPDDVPEEKKKRKADGDKGEKATSPLDETVRTQLDKMTKDQKMDLVIRAEPQPEQSRKRAGPVEAGEGEEARARSEDAPSDLEEKQRAMKHASDAWLHGILQELGLIPSGQSAACGTSVQ